MLVTDIEALFDIGTFEDRLGSVLLSGTEVFDELGGRIVGVGKHYGGFTLNHREKLAIVEARLFKSFDEKGVLHDFQLDLFAESGTTQFTGLHRVQTSDIGNVETRIGLNLLA